MSRLEIEVFSVSPASLFRGQQSRQRLRSLAKKWRPDMIYSVGFPSYVVFNQPEIGRYTNPWEIQPLEEAWAKLGWLQSLKRRLLVTYRRYWARKADFYETQTITAKRGICFYIGARPDQIHVVPNVINPRFASHKHHRAITSNKGAKARIFCLAADHWHKNLIIIPDVAQRLKEKNVDCVFCVTLPHASPIWEHIKRAAAANGTRDMVTNLSPLSLESCVDEYKKASCVFHPTLAEIFSATYLEAMAMGVPIITSNLDFARDVCGNAAFYFDPDDAEQAANALAKIIQDKTLAAEFECRGKAQLQTFPDVNEQKEMIFRIFHDVAATVQRSH